MRSCHGIEVCALSGIFMLSLIGNKYNPNNTEYRDDRLEIFKNTKGRNLNKLKKLFKKYLRTKV